MTVRPGLLRQVSAQVWYQDRVWSRWALAVGAVGALLITPPFALSYVAAYGMPGESPAAVARCAA